MLVVLVAFVILIVSRMGRDEVEPPSAPQLRSSQGGPASTAPAPGPLPKRVDSDPEPYPQPEAILPPEPSRAPDAVQNDPPTAVSVTGWLFGSGGDPLSQGEIELCNLSTLGFRRKAQVTRTGEFRVDGLEPGEYSAGVRLGDQSFRLPDCRITVGAEGYSGLEIRLPGRSSVQGNLVGCPEDQGLHLAVSRRASGNWELVAWSSAARDGSFTLRHLASGRYRLFATGSRCPGQSALAELDLRDGEHVDGVKMKWVAGQPLILYLSDGDGRPIQDALRILYMPEGRAMRVIQDTPEEDGRLHLGSVAAGKLTLIVSRVRGGGKAAQLKLEIQSGEPMEGSVPLE